LSRSQRSYESCNDKSASHRRSASGSDIRLTSQLSSDSINYKYEHKLTRVGPHCKHIKYLLKVPLTIRGTLNRLLGAFSPYSPLNCLDLNNFVDKLSLFIRLKPQQTFNKYTASCTICLFEQRAEQIPTRCSRACRPLRIEKRGLIKLKKIFIRKDYQKQTELKLKDSPNKHTV